MSAEENRDTPKTEQPASARGEATEKPEAVEATSASSSEEDGVNGQTIGAQLPAVTEPEPPGASADSGSVPTPVTTEREESAPPEAVRPGTAKGRFEEQPPEVVELPSLLLRRRTRRDVLLFGAGGLASLAGFAYLLPQATLARVGLRGNVESARKEWFLNRALRVDDDVAEALYSRNRLVPTYTKSQITPLKNNYNGVTPDPGYIPEWKLILEGLASGLSVSLDIRTLLTRFAPHEQITRLVCVEGWSVIAWWAGLRFDDLLHAHPPLSQAKWARVESSVNLDANGNPDPYYVSLDLATARHPQTLLATHFNGQPLTVEHGAPLRLLVPVKLGLKNVKAITKIAYVAEEPPDYWAERGYSRYDGI